MSQEIATWTSYILIAVTIVLQIIMWYKRERFLRTITGATNSKIQKLGTMLQILIPIPLTTAPKGQLEKLRKAAVTASNYWIVSVLLTFIVPILLFHLTE